MTIPKSLAFAKRRLSSTSLTTVFAHRLMNRIFLHAVNEDFDQTGQDAQTMSSCSPFQFLDATKTDVGY